MSPASTYAVKWNGAGARFVGHAQLRGRELWLEGRSGAREGRRSVSSGEIVGVEVRREAAGREIEVTLVDGDVVTISSLDRPGSLAELADRLCSLTDSPQA